MKEKAKFWIVMPVYNEEESVGKVFDEWIPVLRSTIGSFHWAAINDGSKDATLQILKQFAQRYSEISVIDKPNSGHGSSCLMGYDLALQNGAQWVFQIDSDGQCDPKFFPQFQKLLPQNEVIMGYRKTRDDGFKRWIISRVVSLVVYLAYGAWVKDANVPYRIMSARALQMAIKDIPKDFFLANVLVSAKLSSEHSIKWVPIHFRDRWGGSPSVKALTFLKHGVKLFAQLRAAKRKT